MASGKSISISVEPKVSGTTAKLCAAALELYLNQTPELDLEVKRLGDGTVMVRFVESKPEKRKFDPAKCCGLFYPECETCDMPCPYR